MGAQLGADLEAILAEFRKLLRTDWRPPARQRVFLFSTLAEYNVYADRVGGTHSSLLGSFWATDDPERPVALYHTPGSALSRMWASHSAFHQFVEQAFPSIPDVWVGEGLASYFGVFLWNFDWGIDEFLRTREAGYFVPLRQLMAEPIESYGSASDNDVAHGRMLQLGALFAYLLHYREDTRTQVNEEGVVLLAPAADYINDRLRGRDLRYNPVHELLTTDLDELEADLRAFNFGR